MKILVFGHRLELGGTQVNAVDLAAELRDRHGHDVIFHAAPGPALALVREKGLRFAPAPDVRYHPSPARMVALRRLVRAERPDLIHAWDWWQGLEAYLGATLGGGVPLVITDMMMTLSRVLPRQVPTTFGVPRLREEARRAGFRRPEVLLPPVDVAANAPGAVHGGAFRDRLGLGPKDILVVSVSRLATHMKSEPLIRAISLMPGLARDLRLTLCLVGDGEARPRLETLAAEANRRIGAPVVRLAGPMDDPRPAYAAADIVLGMGSSALRGMAFAKPVVVVGEAGMARIFDHECAQYFLEEGFYGRGDGDAENTALATALTRLARDEELRARLGGHGRDFVVRNYGLAATGARLSAICEAAVAETPAERGLAPDAFRTAYYYLRERRFLVASRDRIATPRA